jgi:chemotaxis protein MotA
MQALFGLVVILGCVFGGYIAMGGKMLVLWQPWEFVIIAGAAFGAMIVSNTMTVFKEAIKYFGAAFSSAHISKKDYIELLVFLHKIMKIARTKGIITLEKDIENPFQSDTFKNYKSVLQNKHATIFVCDYLRMMMRGADKADQIYNSMDEELNVLKKEKHEAANAITNVSDALPAIGIVAAVLGVIKTMGAMSEPPAVLGKMIAAALVGTFLGVFLAYGFAGPIARKVGLIQHDEMVYYECIKETIVAFASGAQPAIATEMARKIIPDHERPSFLELEKAIQNDK